MTDGMNSPPGGPLNVWHAGSPQPPAVGNQQWRTPVPAAAPLALPPVYRPSHAAPPRMLGTQQTGKPDSRRLRFVDRPSFWYLLMFVAFVLLMLSFWVWNGSTATQLGMSIAIAGGRAS